MTRFVCSLSLLLLFPFTLTPSRENLSPIKTVLIRKDRPSVYVEFMKQGKAAPLFPGEGEDRVWLSLHNNTPWAINFCSLPVPAALGEIGVVYEVKKVSAGIGSTGDSVAGQDKVKPKIDVPSGYTTGDTCTPYSVSSGRGTIFSVPRDHLAAQLLIEIEFWYEWENRDNELGDYPECFVSFESSRLPRSGNVARH